MRSLSNSEPESRFLTSSRTTSLRSPPTSRISSGWEDARDPRSCSPPALWPSPYSMPTASRCRHVPTWRVPFGDGTRPEHAPPASSGSAHRGRRLSAGGPRLDGRPGAPTRTGCQAPHAGPGRYGRHDRAIRRQDNRAGHRRLLRSTRRPRLPQHDRTRAAARVRSGRGCSSRGSDAVRHPSGTD